MDVTWRVKGYTQNPELRSDNYYESPYPFMQQAPKQTHTLTII